MEDNAFNIIVKRSEITKGEKLLESGVLKLVNFPQREDEWEECYTMYNPEEVYIWPTSWGYYGHVDGWVIPNTPKDLLEKGADINASKIEAKLTIEIDETK